MKIAIIILAAGRSARMEGADKLLEKVAGTPLLRLIVGRAVGAADFVGVTLPLGDRGEKRRGVIGELKDVSLIDVRDADEGMSASIRAGVAHFADCDAIAVVPADMPELTAGDFATVIKVARDNPTNIVRAVDANGRAGHPVVFPSGYIGELEKLVGDQGGKSIVSQSEPVLVPLPDQHATTDLDTQADWDAWRAKDAP